MKITDQMVRAARETFDDVSGSPLELATNDAWRAALEAALAVDGLCLVPKEELAVVLYAASLHDDEGPAGEGWQSTALEYACENVEMCLAAANDGEERK